MKLELHKLQIARRAVQFAVLVFILSTPAIARYHNYLAARELDANLEKWHGTLQGRIMGGIDLFFRSLPDGEKERVGRMVRNRTQVLVYAQQARGGVWSAEIGRLSLTDPLAGAESMVASGSLSRTLLISLLVPVVLTLLLGRVFCSWICPVNLLLEGVDKLRGLLRFLELEPRDIHFSRSLKFILLGLGLALAALLSVPILGYIYPPAIISRELHDLVFGIFDRAEDGRFGFWTGGLTWMSLILLGIALVELTISRRWWCRYLCPGGALYSLLGWARLVRVRRSPPNCTQCGACTTVCPVALDPMRDLTGRECDNCGLCVSHCNDDALDLSLWRPAGKHPSSSDQDAAGTAARRSALTIAFFLLAFTATATAHHILGIPHYAYDERYPQTPVLTYLIQAGQHEVEMTGYPGKPRPGEQCALNVYIRRQSDGQPFDGRVTLTVFQDRLLGSDPVIYGPIEARLEEAVYKFYPLFRDEANYLARIEFTSEDVPWIIDLPMVAGEPGSPWEVVGGVAAGVFLFLIVVRAIRIKRQRHASAPQTSPLREGAVS